MSDVFFDMDDMHANYPSPGLSRMRNPSHDLHTLPTWQTHRACFDCWCGPEVTYENQTTGARCYKHKPSDNPGN